MRLRRMLLSGAVLAGLVVPASAHAEQRSASSDVTPVTSVDLVRYQGTWVQVASIPQPFQRECARNDRANYTVLPNGQVRVLNSCTRADGSTVQLEGRARPEDATTTSRLEVSFVNIGGEWNFDNPGTYWVIGLGPDYQWAVVGAPDRRSGFVLARTPHPTPRQIAQILKVLLRNGYDPCEFVITAQDGGAPQAVPVC